MKNDSPQMEFSQENDVSPYDSVSNFGEDEPMETSFQNASLPMERNNMSFGSDVASALSAGFNTSVQVRKISYLYHII